MICLDTGIEITSGILNNMSVSTVAQNVAISFDILYL